MFVFLVHSWSLTSQLRKLYKSSLCGTWKAFLWIYWQRSLKPRFGNHKLKFNPSPCCLFFFKWIFFFRRGIHDYYRNIKKGGKDLSKMGHFLHFSIFSSLSVHMLKEKNNSGSLLLCLCALFNVLIVTVLMLEMNREFCFHGLHTIPLFISA